MSFYRNSSGAVAKLLRTGSGVVVMFAWCTRFFPSEGAAIRFLTLQGFTF